MLCGKTNDNSKDNKLLLLIVIITGFLHIKIYKKFKQDRFWIFVVFVGILFVLGYKILTYDEDKVYVKWDDDTVGWIIAQEIPLAYNYDKINESEIPDIHRLDLDAEMIKNIKDLKYCKNLEYLILNVKNVKNIKILQSLDKLDTLVLINGNTKILKSLKKLNISTLILKNCTFSSVESLLELNHLSKLEIENTLIKDASALEELSKLSYLSLNHVETEKPIILCKGAEYGSVTLSNVNLEDLEVLGSYKNLTFLYLEKINLSNYTNISFPEQLKTLALKECGLENFKLFSNLSELVSLDVSGNQIRDIRSLADFHNLKELSLANNPIEDISPVNKLKGSVKLNLSGIHLDKDILDLLAKMRLEELYLSNCNLSDLYFLEGHREIKKLDLSKNQITDIEVLKMYRAELNYLNISWNPIRDFRPLEEWIPAMKMLMNEEYYSYEGAELDISGIPLEEIDEENGIEIIAEMLLKKLFAQKCGLKSLKLISVQTKLQYLDVSGNSIEDLTKLCGVKFLKQVLIKDNLVTEKDINLDIPLTLPGTYGVPIHWKTSSIIWHSNGMDGKMQWMRVIFK